MSTSPSVPNEQSYRPPGGKALLRQLQQLESAGYIESGATSLESLTVADSQAIAQVYAEAAAKNSPPDKTLPQWKSIGPSKIINGQISGYDEGSASINQRINVSGRISAVLVDPKKSDHILVGSANGGIWESKDRGKSWEARSDYAPSLSIGALAFDPKDSTIVYAGTGEGNAGYSYLGQGILHSTNGGTNWKPLCTNPFVGLGFYDLVVDPNNSQRLFAAVTNGLYISNDSGVSWKRAANIPNGACWSIAISSDGKEILAACESGLWQSKDGAENWTRIFKGSFVRLAVALTSLDQSVAYLWGADSQNNGYVSSLWRRVDNQWIALNVPQERQTNKQVWYNWCLAIAPDNKDQIYCGAVALYQVNVNSSTPPSADWINISAKQKLPGQELQGNSIHADQHTIAFDSEKPATIYVGNDGGLFRSKDRGINWESLNEGLIISEFEYLAQDDRDPNWIMGGTQDNGTLIWTGNPDYIYTLVGDGDGGDCGVNGSDARIAFRTYTNLNLYRSVDKGHWNSWEDIAPFLDPSVNPDFDQSLFYPPFEVSATGGSTISIGGSALYISRNNGTNWIRLEQDISYKPILESLGKELKSLRQELKSLRQEWEKTQSKQIEEQIKQKKEKINEKIQEIKRKYGFLSAMYILNNDTVYVGTELGRVFKTVLNGEQWDALKELTSPEAASYISDIFVSGSTIWITHRSHGFYGVWNKLGARNKEGCVYRSDDDGKTWLNCSNGLPSVPVNAIAVDPQNPNRIWVGTDVGVYQSLDNGGNWHSFSKSLPNVYVGDLVFHAEARLLRAGTRNRGIWEVSVDG